MVTMTLAVPSEIKTRMETFPEINWSEVARQAFRHKLSDLELLEKIKSKSMLTEETQLNWEKNSMQRCQKDIRDEGM